MKMRVNKDNIKKAKEKKELREQDTSNIDVKGSISGSQDTSVDDTDDFSTSVMDMKLVEKENTNGKEKGKLRERGKLNEKYLKGVGDTFKGEGKKKIKPVFIGGGVLIIIIGGIVTFISGGNSLKDEDMLPSGGISIDDQVVNVEGEEDVVDDNVTTDSSDIESELTTDGYIKYTNDLIGLKIDYPSNWYVEERTDILLNMVKASTTEGVFDIETTPVKLAGAIIDFTSRDDLGTKISLGVSPLQVSGEVELAPINSLSDIMNGGTASQIDEQIKTNAKADGSEIVEHIPSEVKQMGAYNVINSAYVFKKNGITMEVNQMIIPYGVNNIVLTATNKKGDSNIDKPKILLDMVNSLGNLKAQDGEKEQQVEGKESQSVGQTQEDKLQE